LNFLPFVTENDLRGIGMGMGPMWGSGSLTPLSSLGERYFFSALLIFPKRIIDLTGVAL